MAANVCQTSVLGESLGDVPIGGRMEMDYIIITPAYNEEKYIADTIDSVFGQTIQPKAWIIVDDGSSDKTAQIVEEKTASCPWVHRVYRRKVSNQSYYASNVFAIEEGLRCSEGMNYQFLAILDADISLPNDYYERIFRCFENDEKLGIASGIYLVPGRTGFRREISDRRSCPKNIMVVRPDCFQEIGGFVPLKYGGEDTCACFMARMKGWKVWSFPDIEVRHIKPVGTGHAKSLWKIRFRQGREEYFLATHPFFMVVKSLLRCVRERPFLLGGFVRIAGYIYGYFSREQRQIQPEVVNFIQREQMGRLLSMNRISCV